MSDDQVKQEPQITPTSDQNESADTNQDGSKAPEVLEELSKVASSPKRNIIVLVSMILGFGVMAYNLLAPQLFGADKKSNFEDTVDTPTSISKPAESKFETPPIPQLPEPPKLVAPTPPPPSLPPEPQADNKTEALPPQPIAETAPPSSDTAQTPLPSDILGNSDEVKKRKEAKRKSSVVLIAGAQTPHKTDAEIEQTVDFKKRGNLSYVLGRGKILEATTESAINTDFGGEIRALISRDVYAENGKIILIPKGSRVFGTYKVGVEGAYGRISVAWNRIDLMTGYTLTLAADGVDGLGRKGVQGRVDNKYTERMTNAVLMSAFNVAIAQGIDKLVPPVANSQTSAANTTLASNIQTTANTVYNSNGPVTTLPQETTQINAVCTQIQALLTSGQVPLTTSANLTQACTTASYPPGAGGGVGARWTVLSNTINSIAAGLFTNAATNSTPTQAQTAAKQAFTDVTATVKDIMQQDDAFKPNITIDQGHPIKIYVNKDYLFPRDAVSKARVIQ